jgi:hypothetical protein
MEVVCFAYGLHSKQEVRVHVRILHRTALPIIGNFTTHPSLTLSMYCPLAHVLLMVSTGGFSALLASCCFGFGSSQYTYV